MQTILGSNGQIGTELAKTLYRHYSKDIRLVSRNPQRIHDSDQLVPADLLLAEDADMAVKDSDIVYFTLGLPMNSQLWETQYLRILQNVINAAKKYDSKFVYFDNTYMYAKDNQLQSETSSFVPNGRKSVIRAQAAELVLQAIKDNTLLAVICRAPEFYGPGRTQSITNSLVFNRIKQGKKPIIPVNDQVLRTLIWTPDASKAIALIGNTPSAYRQTWHLPSADPVSYKEIITLTEEILHKKIPYTIVKMWLFKLLKYFNPRMQELQELLPRYQVDNLFSSEKFKTAFPNFKITSYKEGISQIFK
ncbi:NAD-dependent epimerase/dehydratase family protein [Weissella oryzae SG25]|uniref:NAD-dependent epimerase/dehydratase family protein n=1 Tax=Weissella oryzae (strain DSM 25784 / JCM 18191 / LMG 30913 / SG25) TaxID=1329250 RepID=A0A069CWI4_WEIOS|nr:NAD-dependent epimerase/dehydratase family protein [Weissella oryzae]GAK31789.1 NAD-dependent epimerase/dehydratase family protein [Weissella oryzae SG25]